jgi:hypothetical protein
MDFMVHVDSWNSGVGKIGHAKGVPNLNLPQNGKVAMIQSQNKILSDDLGSGAL